MRRPTVDTLLWALIALYALVLVLPDAFPRILGSPLVVPAVVLLPLAFVVIHGTMRYGIGAILVFLGLCLGISNVMENLGVATGFPFGHYHYTTALGPKLLLVPLLIGPSYAGMGYVSWVLATVLLGAEERRDKPASVAIPVIATFLMVGWDVCLDPGASTINRQWIWEKGGGYFGVPFVNFLGWYLTVYLIMQAFAFYLARRRERAVPALPARYWLQASAFFAAWALDFIASYLGHESVLTIDATGRLWETGNIGETTAIVSLNTMLFVAVVSAFVILRRK